jgi:hypothetical protein
MKALIQEWRERADMFERHSVPQSANAYRVAIEELTYALRKNDPLLTLTEAARASGHTADHIRRLSQSGHLTNYGRRGAPRYLQSELPLRPAQAETSVRAIARAVLMEQ